MSMEENKVTKVSAGEAKVVATKESGEESGIKRRRTTAKKKEQVETKPVMDSSIESKSENTKDEEETKDMKVEVKTTSTVMTGIVTEVEGIESHERAAATESVEVVRENESELNSENSVSVDEERSERRTFNIEYTATPTMAKQIDSWVDSYTSQAEHNVFVRAELEKLYNIIIKKFEETFSCGGVGALKVNFPAHYRKLAKEVYDKFQKKFFPEAFNEFWNSRLKSDNRISSNGVCVCVVTEKRSPRTIAANLEWLKEEFLCFESEDKKGLLRNFFSEKDGSVFLDDTGEGILYWNSGVIIDDDYVRRYLRKYFERRILKPFFETVKKNAQASEYTTKYNPKELVYVYEESNLRTDLKIHAIRYLAGVTNEKILRLFKEFAMQEELTMEIYYDVGILIGVGNKLYERL